MNQLWSNRSRGLSEMWEDNLRRWISEARETEIPNATKCLKVVNLVHMDFWDSLLKEEANLERFDLDHEGGWKIKGDWNCGGVEEDDIGDPELPPQCDHQTTCRPAWIMTWPKDRDQLPQYQSASTYDNHEGGGIIRDLTRPAQGILCLGQGQVT